MEEFGLYEQFLQKTTESQIAPSLDITFSDILDDLPNRTEPIDLALVQNQGEIIREVIQRKDRGSPDMSQIYR